MDNTNGYIDWGNLNRPVTYQVWANEILGWVPVSAHTYRQLNNPRTRRILIRDTKTVSHEQLPPLPTGTPT